MTDEDVRRKLVNNERLKLLASFMNGIGIAMFAVGGIAPMISNFYGEGGVTGFVVMTSTVCILAAFVLHYWGSSLLGRLAP